jgi:hypothetical protein
MTAMRLGRIVIGGFTKWRKDEQFLDDVEGVQGRTSFCSVLTNLEGAYTTDESHSIMQHQSVYYETLTSSFFPKH